MTLHKLTAGDGYTYLTRQVAVADSTERGYSSLGDYYAAKGESPGRWTGRGLESLGTTGVVTEQQMRNLFGMGIHPDAERIQAQLVAQGWSVPAAAAAARLGAAFPIYEGPDGWHQRLAAAYADFNEDRGRPPQTRIAEDDRARIRTDQAREMFREQHHREPGTDQELTGFLRRVSRPERSAVAGFDLTFSPVKSVSTLWAVAPREISERVEAAHAAAVAATLRWLEKEVGYTRVGTGGPAQVDVRGLVMAQFTHRDSRAGDPDLHTHVAVSNKVQTLGGRWLALDARMLYRFNVAGSEYYNTALEAELTQALGVTFAERDSDTNKRPVREIVGIDARLNEAWSSRATAITATTADLQARFRADHGRVPTTVEMISLRQQANLATRQAKHEPRSLNEQRAAWHDQAVRVLAGEPELHDMITTALTAGAEPPPAVDASLIEKLAAQTVGTVAEHRAQWRESNLHAEALRVVRGTFPNPAQAASVAAAITQRATGGDHSVPIGMDTEITADRPTELNRLDGESVYRVAKAQLFTSPAVLAAEARIVDAAGRTDGLRVRAGDVALAELEWSANTGGRVLNTGQAAMVRDIATSGRRVQLALAPAGTGKTTVMGVLAAAWRNGGGTVVGLAPQASAAQELGAAIPGVHADTLDKLVHDLERLTPDQWQPWMTGIGPRSLVLVDEAGLASTPKLDTAIAFVTSRGGRVLLVGDDRQRAASGAGGVLRDIESAHGAVTLTEVLRFTDPTEGQASLALRAGDPSAAGFYVDRSRVHAVTGDTAADAVYRGWVADTTAGVDSVMIAPTLDMVAQLNARARADRITAAAGDLGLEQVLPNGERVSAGDTVITKRNKRILSMGGTDFVRNNYRWTVQQVNPDGSLLATEKVRGVTRVLPAWYLKAGFLRLGYAYTHASVQGMTIGTAHRRRGTAHTVVTDQMTRQDLYPAMTRATDGTHAYVILGGEGDPHEVITPEAIQPPTAVEVLTAVIGRDGAARSATTEIRDAQDPAGRLAHAVAAYVHALGVGAVTVLGPNRVAAIITAAEHAVPGVTEAPAWDTLLGHLAVLGLDGNDPIQMLTDAAARRELKTADDLAAVLDCRLDPTGNHSQRPGPLPWTPDIPQALAETPVWATYLAARGTLITDLVTQLKAQVRDWTRLDAPAWAVPYLHNRDLTIDLAVWRASNAVSVDDLRPAGDRPRRIAMRHRHTALIKRCLEVAGGRDDGADRWATVLTEHGADTIAVVADEFWPVLVGRLNLTESAGLPVHALLTAAVRLGPLPAEQTAAALWWRLAPHLGSVVATTDSAAGHLLRPTWTSVLIDRLGPQVGERIVTDRLWPTLVAQVDAAARAGHDPVRAVGDAAGMLAATVNTVPEHQWATVLLWHISTLTDPAPVHDEEAAHPDPADADLDAPTDLHDPAGTESETSPDQSGSGESAHTVGDVDFPADVQELPPDPLDTVDGEADDAEPAVGEASVLAALAAGAAFYTAVAARSWVPAYLTGRGLPATAAGYAPVGWTALVDHLRAAGHTDQVILAAGLARHSSRGGLIDFFHNRAVLPITRPQDGAVVAFIGRKHPDDVNDQTPKYLNTPTTMLFSKSDLPFGLTPQQVAALRAGADLVIVEGPMDALAVNIARPDLVAVAPLGTALTTGHLSTLNTIAPLADRRVLLALDNDKAGRAATVRAWRALTLAGVTDAETLTFDGGKDGAELLAAQGVDALGKALEQPRPLADLVVDEITHRWTDGNDFVEHRINALREAAPLIATMTSAQQVRQAGRVADRLDLDYLTVIDAILEHAPIDHDAIAPDPTDPLRLPKRPKLSTDLPAEPDLDADLAREQDPVGSRLADWWRQEQARQALNATVAALLDEAWKDRPELANRIRTAAAIDDIGKQVEQLQQDGVDVGQVLADLPVADLDLVDDPARYTADLLRERTEATTDQDVSAADLSRVASLIVETWPDTADLAHQVIEDPGFPTSVRAIMVAETQGLDAAELLARVPRETVAAVGEKASFVAHALRVAATETAEPNRGRDPHPADDRTWHLDGAADVLRNAWREHHQAVEKVIASPGFDLLAARMAEAQQAGMDAGTLLETIDPEKIAAANVPSPAGITAAALDRIAAEAKIPAWTEREYGHFTDETLTAELAHTRAQLDTAITDRAALAEEARALEEAVAAGRGPAVQQVDQELAELRDIGHELARHGAHETDWRTAVLAARDAAIGAALAEHERDQLGARSRRRRAELDTRILELRQQEAEVQSAADAIADEAKALVRVPKDQVERAQLAERIAAAETRHNELRRIAAAKDQEAAQRMALQAAAPPDRRHMDLLDAEVRIRAELSPHRQHQEGLGREAQLSATMSSTGSARTSELCLPGLNVQPVPIEPPMAVPPPQPSL